jgi:hypothetical protein
MIRGSHQTLGWGSGIVGFERFEELIKGNCEGKKTTDEQEERKRHLGLKVCPVSQIGTQGDNDAHLKR